MNIWPKELRYAATALFGAGLFGAGLALSPMSQAEPIEPRDRDRIGYELTFDRELDDEHLRLLIMIMLLEERGDFEHRHLQEYLAMERDPYRFEREEREAVEREKRAAAEREKRAAVEREEREAIERMERDRVEREEREAAEREAAEAAERAEREELEGLGAMPAEAEREEREAAEREAEAEAAAEAEAVELEAETGALFDGIEIVVVDDSPSWGHIEIGVDESSPFAKLW